MDSQVPIACLRYAQWKADLVIRTSTTTNGGDSHSAVCSSTTTMTSASPATPIGAPPSGAVAAPGTPLVPPPIISGMPPSPQAVAVPGTPLVPPPIISGMILDESHHLEIYQLAVVAQAAIADVQVALERIERVLRGARCSSTTKMTSASPATPLVPPPIISGMPPSPQAVAVPGTPLVPPPIISGMVLDESHHLEISVLAVVAQAAIADVQFRMWGIEGVLRGARCLVFGVATVPPMSGSCDTAGRKGKSSKGSAPY